MRKLLTLLIMLATLATLVLPACAEELVPETEPIENRDSVVEMEQTNINETADEGGNNDVKFVDRLIEMIDGGTIREAVGLIAALILTAAIYYLKKQLVKFVTGIKGAGGTFSAKMDESTTAAREIFSESASEIKQYVDKTEGSLREFIESNEKSLEAMEQKMLEFAEKLQSKVDEVTAETNKAENILVDLAKIIDVVYMGSSTIPAVVKEKVMEIYEHASKIMTDNSEDS